MKVADSARFLGRIIQRPWDGPFGCWTRSWISAAAARYSPVQLVAAALLNVRAECCCRPDGSSGYPTFASDAISKPGTGRFEPAELGLRRTKAHREIGIGLLICLHRGICHASRRRLIR